MTPTVARQLGLGTNRGALVVSVAEGSPAGRAGLRGASPGGTGALSRGGDVLVGVDGRRISSPEDLAEAIGARRPDDMISVEALRAGRRITARVQLAERGS